jgi:hypothetical protein
MLIRFEGVENSIQRLANFKAQNCFQISSIKVHYFTIYTTIPHTES